MSVAKIVVWHGREKMVQGVIAQPHRCQQWRRNPAARDVHRIRQLLLETHDLSIPGVAVGRERHL